jgi:hypothetical protein
MIEPGEMMPLWYKTACDNCGCEFQATRTVERKRPPDGDLVCDDCEMYALGFKDGLNQASKDVLTESVVVVDLLDRLEKLDKLHQSTVVERDRLQSEKEGLIRRVTAALEGIREENYFGVYRSEDNPPICQTCRGPCSALNLIGSKGGS